MQKLITLWSDITPEDTITLIESVLNICPYFEDESWAKDHGVKPRKLSIQIIIEEE